MTSGLITKGLTLSSMILTSKNEQLPIWIGITIKRFVVLLLSVSAFNELSHMTSGEHLRAAFVHSPNLFNHRILPYELSPN